MIQKVLDISVWAFGLVYNICNIRVGDVQSVMSVLAFGSDAEI